MALDPTSPDPPLDAETIAALREENRRLRQYERAVRSAHNGYSPSMRDAMPALKEPRSPRAAIRDLTKESEEIGYATAETIAEAELTRLRADLSAALAREADCKRLLAEQAERVNRAKGVCYAHGLDLAAEELRDVAACLTEAASSKETV